MNNQDQATDKGVKNQARRIRRVLLGPVNKKGPSIFGTLEVLAIASLLFTFVPLLWVTTGVLSKPGSSTETIAPSHAYFGGTNQGITAFVLGPHRVSFQYKSNSDFKAGSCTQSAMHDFGELDESTVKTAEGTPDPAPDATAGTDTSTPTTVASSPESDLQKQTVELCTTPTTSIKKPGLLVYLALFGPTFLHAFAVALALVLFISVLRKAQEERPFDKSVPRRLKQLALLIGVGPYIGSVITHHAYTYVFHQAHVSGSFSVVGFTSWYPALLIYAVAKIIQYGVSLQEEVEATV